MGPLVTAAHRDRVASYVDAGGRGGRGAGASTVASLAVDGAPDGFWLGPTLFDHVDRRHVGSTPTRSSGPCSASCGCRSYDEAVALVNRQPTYGNGIAIFTSDGGAARRFQHEVEVGMVGINVPIPVPMAYYSFGGWGGSLFGDTHVHGTEGVHFYTRAKVVTARWADPSTRGPDLGFPRND